MLNIKPFIFGRLISYSEYRKVWSLHQALHCIESLPTKTFICLSKHFHCWQWNGCQNKNGLDQNIQASCFMQTQFKDWGLSKCLKGNGFVTKYS